MILGGIDVFVHDDAGADVEVLSGFGVLDAGLGIPAILNMADLTLSH